MMSPTFLRAEGRPSSYVRLRRFEGDCGLSHESNVNGRNTHEGKRDLGGCMTSDSKEGNFTVGNPSEEILLTADEVAEILRVPRSWVYSHLGDLPVIRLGRYVRFKRSDIDEFLTRGGSCQ